MRLASVARQRATPSLSRAPCLDLLELAQPPKVQLHRKAKRQMGAHRCGERSGDAGGIQEDATGRRKHQADAMFMVISGLPRAARKTTPSSPRLRPSGNRRRRWRIAGFAYVPAGHGLRITRPVRSQREIGLYDATLNKVGAAAAHIQLTVRAARKMRQRKIPVDLDTAPGTASAIGKVSRPRSIRRTHVRRGDKRHRYLRQH